MKIALLAPGLILICSFSAAAQIQDTLYFNASGRDTTIAHANATFYRVRIRQGAGWQVSDHLIDGKTQMTGAFSDDSCKVKQGEFTWFDTTGVAVHKGSYYNNKEIGKVTYTWPNGKLMMTGSYNNGQRDGEWVGYYLNGQVSGDAIYENGKQVSGTFYKEDGSGNPKVKEFIRESEYPGGAGEWLRYLGATMKYPKHAWKNKIEGTVIVQFVIDEQGSPAVVRVIKSVDPDLDAEAVRVISQSKDWTPAIYGGRPIKSYKKQPMAFKLQNP